MKLATEGGAGVLPGAVLPRTGFAVVQSSWKPRSVLYCGAVHRSCAHCTALCKQSSVWKERELVILCNLCVKPCTFCLFEGLRGLGGSWTCVISVKFCKFCLFLCGTEAAGRTLTAILFMNECAKDCNLNACANFEDCVWKQECPFHHDFHIWMDALPFLFMPL